MSFSLPRRARKLVGRALGRIVDPLIVLSFDRTGFRIHSLAFDPHDLDVDLSGRRCLVTGANSGIGYETASALAARGGEVVLWCRNPKRGERAAETLTRESAGDRRALWRLCRARAGLAKDHPIS